MSWWRRLSSKRDSYDALDEEMKSAILDQDRSLASARVRDVAPLDKFDATAAPAVTDDKSKGYTPGSTWIDVTNDKAYICVDATVGAAVWREASAIGLPGSGSMTTVKEATVQVGGADIVTLDFGAGFGLTEDPDTEINIALDLSEIAAGGELAGFMDAPTVDTSLPGLRTFQDGIATDTIVEETATAGVTIDGTLIKDNYVYPLSTNANCFFRWYAGSGGLFYFQADDGDYILYSAGANIWYFYIGGTSMFEINATTIDAKVHKIVNVVDPAADQDAATKKYVDDNIGGHTQNTDTGTDSPTFLVDSGTAIPHLAIGEHTGGTGDFLALLQPAHTLTGNRVIALPDASGEVALDSELPAAASTTVQGIVELATAAETTTGTDAGRAVTPDGLAGSNFGIRYAQMTLFDWTTDVEVVEGGYYLHIPPGLNGMNLVYCHAEVITAGTTGTMDVQIHNVDNAMDMLSTKLTIDTAETGSDTAAAPYVINTSNDHVNTNDVVRLDVDAIHTTPAKGLIVTLGFALP